jgi:hypothetical protein
MPKALGKFDVPLPAEMSIYDIFFEVCIFSLVIVNYLLVPDQSNA